MKVCWIAYAAHSDFAALTAARARPLPTPFETFRRRRQYGGPPGLAGNSDAALIILATQGAPIFFHIQASQRRSLASPVRHFIYSRTCE